MNFFQHQQDARRQTGRLVALFIGAVISLIVLTNVLVAAFLWGIADHTVGNYQSYAQLDYQADHSFLSYLNWPQFFHIAAWVAGTVALVIAYKWNQLKRGGRVVAERLGGRAIAPDSQAPNERRLLNIVEEMAIAAGLPVPQVYLLEDGAINAFAAGFGPADAVIGVTRGTINQLNRDQLQGVIAHEFSHILNGDMRLNMRLIAVLAGILFIGHAGKTLLRGTRHGSRKSSGAIALLGLGLLVIGYLGLWFGNLIKAAVSRQREFLADASAVQFTRNPDGIADALKVLGGSSHGSQLSSRNAAEHSHLFFGSALARKAHSVFATHPPLDERIRRIDRQWDGQYLSTATTSEPATRSTTTSDITSDAASALHQQLTPEWLTLPLAERVNQTPVLQPEQLNNSRIIGNQLPDQLIAASRNTYRARALILALLADTKPDIREQQLALTASCLHLRDQVEELLPYTDKLSPEQRLPLVELAVPALKQLTHYQHHNFEALVQLFIEQSPKAPLFNWLLQQLLNHLLESVHRTTRQKARTINSLKLVDIECLELLSFIAHKGHRSFNHAEHAFHQGIFVGQVGPANLIDEAQLSYSQIAQVLRKLARLSPAAKQQLLRACAACIESDNKVTLVEWEIVRTTALILDCPIPAINFRLGEHV